MSQTQVIEKRLYNFTYRRVNTLENKKSNWRRLCAFALNLLEAGTKIQAKNLQLNKDVVKLHNEVQTLRAEKESLEESYEDLQKEDEPTEGPYVSVCLSDCVFFCFRL